MAEGLPWIIVAALAIALVVLAIAWRRRATAARAARDADRAAAQERAEALEAARSAEVQQMRGAHENAMVQVRAEHDRAREEAAQARERLARTLSSEKVSQRLIAQACDAVGLSGVLVTNVVFVPEDPAAKGTYIAQVDHVLLSRQTIMLIENKHWQGIVFDGVQPSSVLPPLGPMLDEDALVEPFAVQLAPTSPSTWTVRHHLDQKSPATQVRRQAQRLSAYLTSALGAVPWLETAVLYSHSRASVYAKPENRSPNGAPTKVIAGYDELVGVLTEVAKRAPTTLTPTRLGELHAHFVGLGAHVEAVGPSAG